MASLVIRPKAIVLASAECTGGVTLFAALAGLERITAGTGGFAAGTGCGPRCKEARAGGSSFADCVTAAGRGAGTGTALGNGWNSSVGARRCDGLLTAS